MKTKDNLISECKYFKGSTSCPFEKSSHRYFFWIVERAFVNDFSAKGASPDFIISKSKEALANIDNSTLPKIPDALMACMVTTFMRQHDYSLDGFVEYMSLY